MPQWVLRAERYTDWADGALMAVIVCAALFATVGVLVVALASVFTAGTGPVAECETLGWFGYTQRVWVDATEHSF